VPGGQRPGPGQDLRQTAPCLLADVHGHEYARRQVGREAADELDEGLDPAGRPSDRHHTRTFHVE
jgi:hypothetical protein